MKAEGKSWAIRSEVDSKSSQINSKAWLLLKSLWGSDNQLLHSSILFFFPSSPQLHALLCVWLRTSRFTSSTLICPLVLFLFSSCLHKFPKEGGNHQTYQSVTPVTHINNQYGMKTLSVQYCWWQLTAL